MKSNERLTLAPIGVLTPMKMNFDETSFGMKGWLLTCILTMGMAWGEADLGMLLIPLLQLKILICLNVAVENNYINFVLQISYQDFMIDINVT